MLDRIRDRLARAMVRSAHRISAEYSPTSDFWYTTDPSSGSTLSGVAVNADTALRLSTINACIRLLSYSVAMLPWNVYERLDSGRRRRAEGNYVASLLHDWPNEYQTPFEFKQGIVSDLARRGNSFVEKVPGRREATGQLWPIQSEFVTIGWLDRKSGRKRVYKIDSGHDGRARVLNDEQMWHLRLMSLDGGLTGASPITLAREGIGLALSTQVGMARLMANGIVPSVSYSVEQNLTEKQAKELRTQIKAQLSGAFNWGEPLILGKGAKIERPGISPKDAQTVELLNWSVADLARIYGIPLVLLQSESKDTSWGTGIEHLKLAYAAFTVSPICVMLEESADVNLITQPLRLFSEFNMNALLRGDLKSRYEAYAIAMNANNPWLVRNDVRRWENLDPDTSGDGERFLVPQNNMDTRNVPDTTVAHALVDLEANVIALMRAQGIEPPKNDANGKMEAAA